jgi:hypothetical protein
MGKNLEDGPEGQEAKTHWQVAKTHCPKGHEYTLENTKLIKSTKPGKFKRQCWTCKKDFDKASRKTSKAAKTNTAQAEQPAT